MYEFWYDYVQAKYGEKSKTDKMYTDRQLYSLQSTTEDIYVDIETRFDTSNFEFESSLPKGKN